ncbi:helix-turn-helix domain-containing protein [Fibrella sp. WM1]|uniref:helix-turn-helix domain-containing protein n=1 Tax=Fibrella musci TaxID=3242485 RepID=UPI003521CC50
MTRLTTRPALPRIVRVIAVEPFVITALWTTTEIRRIDFARLFDQWKHDEDTRLYPLFDYEVFKLAAVSPARTLHWPTIPIRIELAKRVVEGPLDLDPDELYRQSELVQKTEKLTIGSQLRQVREAAGLSQTEVALKSGTSRNYISRIENGKSDIQLETLNKIVQLGMGKQVRIEIE